MHAQCATYPSSGATLLPRKYKIMRAMLLLIFIPGVMLSSLGTINPWLSACDISHSSESEEPSACPSSHSRQYQKKMQQAGVVSCPKSCPLNQSTSSVPGCLVYLDDSRKNAICNFSPVPARGWLLSLLGQIRLAHCCEHKVLDSLAGPLMAKVLRGKGECFRVIENLMNVDRLAARISCQFNQVLARFDCSQPYSAGFSCEHCMEAYRQWVCTTLIPFFNGSQRIKPCRSVCQAVELKCPYFLPENRSPSLPTQYAGEPAFLCSDLNIRESEEQQLNSIYPPYDTCCVKACGRPYDGNCIQPGYNCDNKFSHDNITQDDCNEFDWNSVQKTGDKCSGPTMHPGTKGLLPILTPYPVLAVSSFLTLRSSYPNPNILLLFPVLLFLCSSLLGVLQLVALLCLATIPPIISLLEDWMDSGTGAAIATTPCSPGEISPEW